MIIRRAELKRIFSHEDTSVTFEGGINAIVGPNGAGKSSIIDAILLALFGTCSRAESVVRANLGDVIKMGNRQGSVEVEFSIGGKEYVARRTIERQRGSATSQSILYLKTGEGLRKIAEGQAVCDELMKLLNVKNIETLTSTIIARQGHLADLLDMRPAELKERILDLAGLSRLEEKAEELRNELRELQRIMGSIDMLKRGLDDKRKRLGELRAKIEKGLKEVEELREKVEAAMRELDAAEEELSLTRSACELSQRLEAIEKIRGRRRELSERLRIIEERLRSWSPEERELAVRIRAGRLSAESAWKKTDQLEGKMRELAARLERLRQEGLPSVEELERRRKEVEERLAEVQRRIGEIEGELKGLEACSPASVGDRCPFCGAPLAPAARDHIIKEREAAREELKRRLQELEEQSRRLREELKRVRHEIEGARLESERRGREQAQLEASLREAEKQLEEARAVVAEYVTLCSRLAHRYGAVPSSPADCPADMIEKDLADLEGLEAEKRAVLSSLQMLEREISEGEAERLKRELESLPVRCDRARLTELEKRVKELRRSLDEGERELGRKEGFIRQSEEEAARLGQEIASGEAELRRLEAEARVYRALEGFSKLLGKGGPLARDLTAALRSSLQAEANYILQDLERDFRVDIGDDFSISVRRQTGRLGVESLSGGERTMLAIALRLALARVLKVPLNSMILDEPTEFLDENARRRMFDIVKNTATIVDQIIVVTHDIEVEEMASRVIRISKAGEESRVTS